MNKYCEEKGFAGWFETSAKDNINIDMAAKFLVGKILEIYKPKNEIPGGDNIVKPTADKKPDTKQGACCS